jgi:hypothetical protein
MSCEICTLAYTLKIRVKTTCNYCGFECCKKCLLTYVKSSSTTIKCMNCKEDIDEDELSKFMSGSYIYKLYNTVIKDYVYEKEKKLLPFTKKQMIISDKKKDLTNTMDSLVEELGESIKEIYVEKINNISLDNFNICLGSCNKYIYRDSDESFYNCEDCSLCWCSKCETHCNPISHVCDANILNSLKSIEKDTRPCPTCGIKIYKIDGCSQIMCSECNTFFDFNTGLKDKDSDTKHARNYIELLNEFEIEVVGEKLYKDFHDNIKVCNNYDLWDSPVYEKFTHKSLFVKKFVAIVINSKNFIRKNLISKLNEKKYNEVNRKDFINNKICEQEFKRYSLRSYKEYKNKVAMAKKLAFLEFHVETIIHKYVRQFNIIRNNNNLTDANAKVINLTLESEIIKFISDNKDKIDSKEYSINDNGQFMKNIKIYSPDRSISLKILDFCDSSNSINF